MAWRRRPEEFPLWGKVVAWVLILSFLGWMVLYAVDHGPDLIIQVVETANSFLD